MQFVGVTDIKSAIKSDKEKFRQLTEHYPDQATRYAYEALYDTRYCPGRDTQLACIRHLQDLLRQNTEAFPFTYELNFAEIILAFAESCPDPISNQPIRPMGWQTFILQSLICWRSKETGGNRFSNTIVSVARSQGKTWLASILMNSYYFVVARDQSNQDFLVASNINSQSHKLYKYVSLHKSQR